MTRDELIETMAAAIWADTNYAPRTAFDSTSDDDRRIYLSNARAALSALKAKGMVVVGKDEVTREHQASAPSNPRASDSEARMGSGSFNGEARS